MFPFTNPDSLYGELEIRNIPHEGPRERLYKAGNVITNLGKQRTLALLAGSSSFPVKKIAIGDNGVVLGPPRLLDVAVAADQEDTALGNLVAEKTAGIVLSFGGSVPKVIFSVEFYTVDSPLTFYNPSEPVINEAGLRALDDMLFSRRTFPSIPFDISDRVGLIFTWTVGAL